MEDTKPRDTDPAIADVGVFDHGRRAWLTLAGGWLVMFCVFGMSNSFGVFQAFYTQSGTASSTGVAWIGSTQGFLMIFMSLPAGRLVDLGYFRPTLLAGSVGYAFL